MWMITNRRKEKKGIKREKKIFYSFGIIVSGIYFWELSRLIDERIFTKRGKKKKKMITFYECQLCQNFSKYAHE